jgi:serine/threonine protein kinase/WD40 repeat protein
MTEETLFAEALELDPSERAAFLDAACGPDRALRGAVGALLLAHHETGPLDHPEAQPLKPDPVDDAAVGTQIEPYTLVQLLGTGGMGCVWVARQATPVKRNVALKLIRAGMDSRAVLTRFEQERQALALMDHPNITRVFDGGVGPDGRPFFVMELVSGLPLLTFCDEARLTVRQRLELFVPICQAVQHAHQKGIIHRDLKPSNILVTLYDGTPVPKVIDFGIAKALTGKLIDETVPTLHGAAVGTVEYMAPEQAGFSALDIDTRADIYSLGVILYELLAGVRPVARERLQGKPLPQLLRVLFEEESPRPSFRLSSDASLPSLAALRQLEPRRLTTLLRGELDWIVMKCLEKSRDRRYATANGLARDIQRYLADEPVEARPPSFRYRVGKLVRRNKGMVLAATLVLLTLIGGIICTTIGMQRAAEAQVVAEEAQRDGQAKLWASYLSEANARRFSGRVGQRFKALEAIRGALQLPVPSGRSRDELRDAAVAALALPDVQPDFKTWPWPQGSETIAFDPVALQFYARGDTQGNITVRRLSDDGEIASLKGRGAPCAIGFGRDGQSLLLFDQGSGAVEHWKIGSATRRRLTTSPRPAILVGSQQCDDGQRLLLVELAPRQVQFRVLETDSGSSLFDRTFSIGEVPPRNRWRIGWRGALSPDGRRLAVAHGEYGSAERNNLLIFDVQSGKQTATLKHSSNVFAPVWYPDNRTVAVGDWDSAAVFIWAADSGGVPARALLELKGGEPFLGASCSGQLLAGYAGWRSNAVLWHPITGKQVLRGCPTVTEPTLDGRLFSYRLIGDTFTLAIAEPSPIFRIFVPDPARGDTRGVTVHPNSRLLAVGHSSGVTLLDLATGLEAAQLTLGCNLFARFDPSSGDLLTYGRLGLYRWPLHTDAASPNQVTVGPSQFLGSGSKGSDAQFDVSRDGKVIVAANYTEATVYRWETNGPQTIRLGPLVDTRIVRVSPDGRWVYSDSHMDGQGKIWDALTGRQFAGCSGNLFTPDSNWLMNGRQFIYPETGEVGRSLPPGPGPLAFTGCGTLFASMVDGEAMHLVELQTGRTLVRLSPPEPSRSWFAAFSPDGTRLIQTCHDHNYVYAWDLRALRRHLVDLGLDWDAPPFPAEPAQPGVRLPLQVRVDMGGLDGR